MTLDRMVKATLLQNNGPTTNHPQKGTDSFLLPAKVRYRARRAMTVSGRQPRFRMFAESCLWKCEAYLRLSANETTILATVYFV
jgi:hypothetical protein